jgi:hypothetical protein
MKTRTLPACALAAAAVCASLAPIASRAETPDEWRFAATIYGWLPSISVDTSFPSKTGGSSVDVTGSDILNALNFTFMGALDAQKGDWGAFTDVIYLNLGASTKQTRDLSVGGGRLPATITGKASLNITGWVWTTAGTYRVVDHPTYTMDVLAGVRLLNLGEDLKWSLAGDLGDPPIIDASGRSNVSDNIWDGIVGFKGRASFGDGDKWFVPYYFDIGTGNSDLTWQGIVGVGYSFDWGDLFAAWRYMDYGMPSKNAIQSADFNGGAIGVTFHF